MSQTVTFAESAMPSWSAVRDLLAARGYPIQMRMIDNQLAFPYEEPPLVWRELRVASSQGMVTLRRELGQITVVTWGNADPPLLQAWNALAWALAEASGGAVESGNGSLSAADFAQWADLPEPLRHLRSLEG